MISPSPVTLIIEDTGIGIRKEDLPRIFEKGYTGVNGRENNRATGIGLYLSKKIMKRLGHRIYVTSEEGKGTKVFLEFSHKFARYVSGFWQKHAKTPRGILPSE